MEDQRRLLKKLALEAKAEAIRRRLAEAEGVEADSPPFPPPPPPPPPQPQSEGARWDEPLPTPWTYEPNRPPLELRAAAVVMGSADDPGDCAGQVEQPEHLLEPQDLLEHRPQTGQPWALPGALLALATSFAAAEQIRPYLLLMPLQYANTRRVDGAGYFTGLLLAALHAGRACSPTVYRRLGAQHRWRPKILTGLVSVATCTLCIGLAQSLIAVILLRFLLGLVDCVPVLAVDRLMHAAHVGALQENTMRGRGGPPPIQEGTRGIQKVFVFAALSTGVAPLLGALAASPLSHTSSVTNVQWDVSNYSGPMMNGDGVSEANRTSGATYPPVGSGTYPFLTPNLIAALLCLGAVTVLCSFSSRSASLLGDVDIKDMYASLEMKPRSDPLSTRMVSSSHPCLAGRNEQNLERGPLSCVAVQCKGLSGDGWTHRSMQVTRTEMATGGDPFVAATCGSCDLDDSLSTLPLGSTRAGFLHTTWALLLALDCAVDHIWPLWMMTPPTLNPILKMPHACGLGMSLSTCSLVLSIGSIAVAAAKLAPVIYPEKLAPGANFLLGTIGSVLLALLAPLLSTLTSTPTLLTLLLATHFAILKWSGGIALAACRSLSNNLHTPSDEDGHDRARSAKEGDSSHLHEPSATLHTRHPRRIVRGPEYDSISAARRFDSIILARTLREDILHLPPANSHHIMPVIIRCLVPVVAGCAYALLLGSDLPAPIGVSTVFYALAALAAVAARIGWSTARESRKERVVRTILKQQNKGHEVNTSRSGMELSRVEPPLWG